MNVWKVILVTLVIFSTGVITGGMIARKTCSPPPTPQGSQSVTNRSGEGFRPDRRLRRSFMTQVGDKLALTTEQTEQIEAILRESQERTRALWEEISPQMRAEFEATQEKIREVLTPEQQQQFEELMKKGRESRRGDRDRRRPEPDRPPGEPAVESPEAR